MQSVKTKNYLSITVVSIFFAVLMAFVADFIIVTLFEVKPSFDKLVLFFTLFNLYYSIKNNSTHDSNGKASAND